MNASAASGGYGLVRSITNEMAPLNSLAAAPTEIDTVLTISTRRSSASGSTAGAGRPVPVAEGE